MVLRHWIRKQRQSIDLEQRFACTKCNPDIYNATRDCVCHMSDPYPPHQKVLDHLMKYVIGTKNHGLVLSSKRIWNGEKEFEFCIHGRSDSDYATNKDDRKSISGRRVFLDGSPVIFWSSTQKFVTLLATEAESAAGVMIAQHMLYVYHLLLSLGLRVELPMLLEMDNKGAVDLPNNWSVGGQTQHVAIQNFFLCELKDKGLLMIKHMSGEDNDVDIFTKNTSAQIFNKHVSKFVRNDEYLAAQTSS